MHAMCEIEFNNTLPRHFSTHEHGKTVDTQPGAKIVNDFEGSHDRFAGIRQ